MLAVIRQFHDGMQACVRLDDGECSDKFDVGQGCVLAPLLFNMFFTAVLRVAEKRFLAVAAITDNILQLQRKEEGENKGTSRTGNVDGRREKEGQEVQRLCGMLYADDAGIVSRSSEGKAGEDDDGDRDYVLIVRAYSIRGNNRDDVRVNQRRGEGVLHHQCSRPGIQTIEFVYFGGAITADRDLSIEITRRLQSAWACFQRCTIWKSMIARVCAYD